MVPILWPSVCLWVTSSLGQTHMQRPHQHQLCPRVGPVDRWLRPAPPSPAMPFWLLPLPGCAHLCGLCPLFFFASVASCFHRSSLGCTLLWPLLWFLACFSPVSQPMQEKLDLLWLFQACSSVYCHIFTESKMLSVMKTYWCLGATKGRKTVTN